MANTVVHAHSAGEGVPHDHHFESFRQQYEAAHMGMWVFLLTEVFFFSVMLVSYAVYRLYFPLSFAAASHHLNVPLGTLNTVVLLASSFTIAMALHAIQAGHSKACFRYLIITLLFAFGFLVIKGIEWHADYVEHLVPFFSSYHFERPETLSTLPDYFAGGTRIFFMLYFCMTGVHALHIIVGMGIIGSVAHRAKQGRYNEIVHTGVELSALYWHFVDVVWIFLFPILYLMDSHVHI